MNNSKDFPYFKHLYYINNEPCNQATFRMYVDEADKHSTEYMEIINNMYDCPYFIHHAFDINNPIYKQIYNLLNHE